MQPHSSLTIGRTKNNYIELNKDNLVLEGYDNTPRQIPGTKPGVDSKKGFKDAKAPFTEEQVKKETARCLKCGASVVDENHCIGCGQCTTKCMFDAIHLVRVHPNASKMYKTEDKLKAILPNMIKRSIKIKFSKQK